MLSQYGVRSVVVGITGASGIVYGTRLVEVLRNLGIRVDVVVSRAAWRVAEAEDSRRELEGIRELGVRIYDEEDFDAPFASSSGAPDAMVIAPCSIKTLSAIAYGFSANLITRAALAVLRLRRPLVLVVRETPLGVVELRAMLAAAEAGAVILPASPGFYHRPRTISDLVDFIVGKILDVLGVEHSLYRRWGYNNSSSTP